MFILTVTLLVLHIDVMKVEGPKFSIDELCALVEMNKRKIRYYIQKGLLDRPEGTGKGAFYTHRHVERLIGIRKWKDAGLSLERIQELFGDKQEDAVCIPVMLTPISSDCDPLALEVLAHLFQRW